MYDEYEKLSAIVSAKGQYANYRRELKDIRLPAIPFLGVYLTDLTFVELANPDFINSTPRRLINFDKRRKVGAIVKEIQHYQTSCGYTHVPMDGVRKFFNSLGGRYHSSNSNAISKVSGSSSAFTLLGEEQLYARSLVLEPRESEDETDEMDDIDGVENDDDVEDDAEEDGV
jgi:hypothetical protein